MHKLISFSGIDGAGKTSQIGNVVDYYRSIGKKCISYVDLPQTEPPIGDMTLREYYNMVNDFDVIVLRSCYREKDHIDFMKYMKNNSYTIEDTYRMQDYFVRDTSRWFNDVIMPLYNDGKIIIFDRYLYDELPYQQIFNKDVSRIKEMIERFPKPHSFYLKIDLETMKKRNSTREDSKNIIFSNDEKIQKIIDSFNDVFSEYNAIQIDARQDVISVSKDIFKELDIN